MEPKLIGVIHTPYKTAEDAPFQGMSSSETCEVEIFKETHTPFDTDIHRGFATQTPNRPNPIGFHVAELIDREENVLRIKRVDALDKTPLIDIKPYPYRDYGKTAVAVAGKDDTAIRIALNPISKNLALRNILKQTRASKSLLLDVKSRLRERL